jgi:hypothetical protein
LLLERRESELSLDQLLEELEESGRKKQKKKLW